MPILIDFAEPVELCFAKSAGQVRQTFEPKRTFFFFSTQASYILSSPQVQKQVFKSSDCEPRLKNFHVDTLKKGESVLLCNASGGFGDALMTLPVARILHKRGAKVHVASLAGDDRAWWNLPYIESVTIVPAPWSFIKNFDHHAIFEHVVNQDNHKDQLHPIDAMLNRIGIDPDSIPPAEKVACPVFTPGELIWRDELRAQHKKLSLFHLASANPVRNLPASASVTLLIEIARAFPETHWYGLGSFDFVANDNDYKVALEAELERTKLTNVEPLCAPSLREGWGLVQVADVVVGIDSMWVHAAGCFNVPCVGLWGPINPENRVRYYQNHHAIYHKERCPASPCFCYTTHFPATCPPIEGERAVCECLAWITHEEVVEAVRTIHD